MENTDNILGKYSRQPYPPLKQKEMKPSLNLAISESEKPYEAVIKIKGMERTDRFKIIDLKGNFDFYNYTHLIEGSFRDGILILTTTTRTFTLSGKNLKHIADLLGDRKVKSLCQFNPDTDTKPTEKDAIIIENIEREE